MEQSRKWVSLQLRNPQLVAHGPDVNRPIGCHVLRRRHVHGQSSCCHDQGPELLKVLLTVRCGQHTQILNVLLHIALHGTEALPYALLQAILHCKLQARTIHGCLRHQKGLAFVFQSLDLVFLSPAGKESHALQGERLHGAKVQGFVKSLQLTFTLARQLNPRALALFHRTAQHAGEDGRSQGQDERMYFQLPVIHGDGQVRFKPGPLGRLLLGGHRVWRFARFAVMSWGLCSAGLADCIGTCS